MMLLIETWWEEIFSGDLSVGLNKKNVHQLSDESFLYFSNEFEMLKQSEVNENISLSQVNEI